MLGIATSDRRGATSRRRARRRSRFLRQIPSFLRRTAITRSVTRTVRQTRLTARTSTRAHATLRGTGRAGSNMRSARRGRYRRDGCGRCRRATHGLRREHRRQVAAAIRTGDVQLRLALFDLANAQLCTIQLLLAHAAEHDVTAVLTQIGRALHATGKCCAALQVPRAIRAASSRDRRGTARAEQAERKQQPTSHDCSCRNVFRGATRDCGYGSGPEIFTSDYLRARALRDRISRRKLYPDASRGGPIRGFENSATARARVARSLRRPHAR